MSGWIVGKAELGLPALGRSGVSSRFRLALIAGSLLLAGCGDLFETGPTRYAESGQLAKDLKDKPKLQDAVRKAIGNLFGESPRVMKVPPGSGLPYGGRRIAGRIQEGEGTHKKTLSVLVTKLDPDTDRLLRDPKTGRPLAEWAEGGYTLYRRHCLHCHGVSGDGAGPTADFLFPRPRDYRKGIFKFTSTNTGEKPTRADLIKTIRYGLPGTSMPAFDALMTPEELLQVLDYVLFLSMRGEVELGLIDAATVADEADPDPLPADVVNGVVETVFTKWKTAATKVLDPPVKRVASSSESVDRGRALFLGRTRQKLDCWGCHGPKGIGDGPSFVDRRIFYEVVFDHVPVDDAIRNLYEAERNAAEGAAEAAAEHGGRRESAAPALEPFDRFLKKNQDLWKQSVDDWGQPLRPADLNLGVYKGGRRPIDLYWRIAKGINGAKMPAHVSTLSPDQIWDLVNFILALPYDPELLRNAAPPPGAAAPALASALAARSATEETPRSGP